MQSASTKDCLKPGAVSRMRKDERGTWLKVNKLSDAPLTFPSAQTDGKHPVNLVEANETQELMIEFKETVHYEVITGVLEELRPLFLSAGQIDEMIEEMRTTGNMDGSVIRVLVAITRDPDGIITATANYVFQKIKRHSDKYLGTATSLGVVKKLNDSTIFLVAHAGTVNAVDACMAENALHAHLKLEYEKRGIVNMLLQQVPSRGHTQSPRVEKLLSESRFFKGLVGIWRKTTQCAQYVVDHRASSVAGGAWVRVCDLTDDERAEQADLCRALSEDGGGSRRACDLTDDERAEQADPHRALSEAMGGWKRDADFDSDDSDDLAAQTLQRAKCRVNRLLAGPKQSRSRAELGDAAAYVAQSVRMSLDMQRSSLRNGKRQKTFKFGSVAKFKRLVACRVCARLEQFKHRLQSSRIPCYGSDKACAPSSWQEVRESDVDAIVTKRLRILDTIIDEIENA